MCEIRVLFAKKRLNERGIYWELGCWSTNYQLLTTN
jgi:hypothetical protein